MNKKYNIPPRKFCKGEKRMVSVRLHDSLTKELKKIAGAKGRDFTDLVTEVLDQYCQFENGKRKN